MGFFLQDIGDILADFDQALARSEVAKAQADFDKQAAHLRTSLTAEAEEARQQAAAQAAQAAIFSRQ